MRRCPSKPKVYPRTRFGPRSETRREIPRPPRRSGFLATPRLGGRTHVVVTENGRPRASSSTWLGSMRRRSSWPRSRAVGSGRYASGAGRRGAWEVGQTRRATSLPLRGPPGRGLRTPSLAAWASTAASSSGSSILIKSSWKSSGNVVKNAECRKRLLRWGGGAEGQSERVLRAFFP